MAIQTINIGNIANDGTGDDLRVAFQKVNDNFEELNSVAFVDTTDAVNIGSAGQGLFVSKDGDTLQFKKIVAGSNTTFSTTDSTITINSSGGLDNILVLSDNGSLTVDSILRIEGGELISTRVSPASSTLFVELDNTGILEYDIAPKLSANLDANSKNIVSAGTISANTFIGPLEGLVNNIDVEEIAYHNQNLDLGAIFDSFDNLIDFLANNSDIDLGSFTDPADFTFNFGSI